MSSRKGNVVLYDDWPREAQGARARDHRGEEPAIDLTDAQKDEIAQGGRYRQHRSTRCWRATTTRVIVFDLEEALSFDGHAAPYIQYAHARACRILERVGDDARRGDIWSSTTSSRRRST